MRFYKPNKGVTLPTLTKPAGPADIVLDKEAINENGMKITGTLKATGGEPSYSLQIATRNNSDGDDSVTYYVPGISEKTNLILKPYYQDIVCGEFICIYRGSTNRVSGIIECMDENSITLLNIGVTSEYGVEHNYNHGWTTLNIGAIKKDYPMLSKIKLDYRD